MNLLGDTSIAIGVIFDGLIITSELEMLQGLSNDILRTFNDRSSLFWQDACSDNALREIWTAGLFEIYRKKTNYLLFSIGTGVPDYSEVVRVVVYSMKKGLDCLSEIKKKPESGLILFSNEAADRMARYDKYKNPFFNHKNINFWKSLYNEIPTLGINHEEIENTDYKDIMPIVPSSYQIPSSVHFIPAGTNATVIDTTVLTNSVAVEALEMAAKAARFERLCVWGAGTIAKAMMSFLGDRVKMIVDTNKARHGENFCGIHIDPPEILTDRVGSLDAIVISPLGREAQIIQSLRNLLGPDTEKLAIVRMGSNSTIVNKAAIYPPKTVPVDNTLQTVYLLEPNKALTRPETTTERTLTKRGVLYVGYPCNIKCVFCYYTYTSNKEWHPIEECIRDANLYRYNYGNEWVDITGGEPTIYPHIFELLNHCRKIKLTPTLITNTQVLSKLDKTKKFQEHGVYDFLCSIHGIADSYDLITARKGAWRKVEQAVANFGKIGMRWRTNCTMTRLNMTQLKAIAQFSFENGSRAINFISYNPFYEWAQKMDIDFQAKHSEITPHLVEALNYCDSVGMEVNVRYFPLCMMKGHEEKAYNYPQLSFDHHEWDYCSWFSEETRNPSTKLPHYLVDLAPNKEGLHHYLARRTSLFSYNQNNICQHCGVGLICDGFTNQYAKRFGIIEMQPYRSPIITDPKYYICNQNKIIDT